MQDGDPWVSVDAGGPGRTHDLFDLRQDLRCQTIGCLNDDLEGVIDIVGEPHRDGVIGIHERGGNLLGDRLVGIEETKAIALYGERWRLSGTRIDIFGGELPLGRSKCGAAMRASGESTVRGGGSCGLGSVETVVVGRASAVVGVELAALSEPACTLRA